MSDWSRKAAQQVQMIRDAKLAQNKKAIHEEEIYKRRAPELWKQLTDLIQQKCTDFNSEQGMSNTLKFSGDKANEFIVNQADNTFKGDFDSTNHRFNFVSSTWTPAHFKLEVRVGEGYSDAVVVDEKEAPIDLELFVNIQLESLLGIS